ncbi:MAG: GspH/FimT family protein [Synechococcus sp. ELA057]
MELLIAISVLGAITLLGLRIGTDALATERVEAATRRIALGLEQARTTASRSGQACGLSLNPEAGWVAPSAGTLRGCPGFSPASGENQEDAAVLLEHNFPTVLRISSNGLVIDGGTVRISAAGTPLVRCLVVSLPLGVVRWGRWLQDSCQPDRLT